MEWIGAYFGGIAFALRRGGAVDEAREGDIGVGGAIAHLAFRVDAC
jgi:hypothetical protein